MPRILNLKSLRYGAFLHVISSSITEYNLNHYYYYIFLLSTSIYMNNEKGISTEAELQSRQGTLNVEEILLSSKLEKLSLLENMTDDNIYDAEDHIILPNLRHSLPSSSLYLKEDVFSKYLDKIILDTLKTDSDTVCAFQSVFITDYFITIDFVDFIYKIPNILLSSLEQCKNNTNIRFYIIPLRLNFNYKDAHSNVIIIDNQYKTIEYFEPHGVMFTGLDVPYDIQRHIKILISRLFPIRSKLYTFKNVQNYCPIGLQGLQTITNPASGHCLAWSLLFINVRINNLYSSTDYIIEYFTKNFNSIDLDKYMRRYIGMLETTTEFANIKTFSNFKYNLGLSRTEGQNITTRIKYLINEYLTDTSTEAKLQSRQGAEPISSARYLISSATDKTNEIFEELISYHKFPFFNKLFFENINTFIHETDKNKSNKDKTNRKKIKLVESLSDSEQSDSEQSDSEHSDSEQSESEQQSEQSEGDSELRNLYETYH